MDLCGGRDVSERLEGDRCAVFGRCTLIIAHSFETGEKKVGMLVCACGRVDVCRLQRDAPLHSIHSGDGMVCFWYVVKRFLTPALTGCTPLVVGS